MLIRNLAILLLCGFSLAVPVQALAACLNFYRTPEDEAQKSQLVFVGKVIAQENTPESQPYLEGTTYTLHVTEVLRGKKSEIVHIFSENSSGRFPMVVGKTYLVFAYIDSGRLQIDNCGSSGELTDRENILRQLKQQRRQGR
jgi:hypothetical protein